jgi:predicted nucleic acid-binding protein
MMEASYVDADVIIRLLTGDDPIKQEAAKSLFEQVEQGNLAVRVPHVVLADVVYVLSSKRLYNKPRSEIAELLLPLVSLPGFRVPNRRAVLTALLLYSANPALDFTDALLIGLMLHAGPPLIYSYDNDYDGIEGITRYEP